MEIIRIEGDPVPAARRAAEVLAKGGIVIYPTDTLYGIAVDALNRRAIERLRFLKGRERRKPISIVVRDVKSLSDHAQVSEEARQLAEQHLPGPLTLVLPAEPHIPEELTLNGQIGVRIPRDSFVEALAYRFRNPFTATSANPAGIPTPGKLDEVLVQFRDKLIEIDLVIDDGDRPGGVPSTVVAYQEGTLRVLREGALTREDLGL